MVSEIETIEPRLKSLIALLQTEWGILERIVYKNKNQHRRSSYFQYLLKVRRDLRLLKSANLEEILNSCFLVINGNRPKQKLQLLESLKRRRCDGGKYNFLERLLGFARLLSQMVEPMLKAAMEISKLLARSFFMGFSVTILAVLARLRVLVQQILLEAVHIFNTVSSLSQMEQTIKLNQKGFEVFREYYPANEQAAIFLECIWQVDKYVLAERINTSETKSQEVNIGEDVSLQEPKIQYENVEVLLGAAANSGTVDAKHVLDEGNTSAKEKNTANEKQDEVALANLDLSSENVVSLEDQSTFFQTDNTQSSSGMIAKVHHDNPAESASDGKLSSQRTTLHASSTASPTSRPVKIRTESKKVAFISVKRPAPSTEDLSRSQVQKPKKNERDEDSFFNLLTGGNQSTLF